MVKSFGAVSESDPSSDLQSGADGIVVGVNPPAYPETGSNGEPGELLGSVLSVERSLELCRLDASAVLVQATVTVTVDPLGGRETQQCPRCASARGDGSLRPCASC